MTNNEVITAFTLSLSSSHIPLIIPNITSPQTSTQSYRIQATASLVCTPSSVMFKTGSA